MKIGILTWHYYLNFGSALQSYALRQTIKNCKGKKAKVRIINYRSARHGKPNAFRNNCRLVVSYLFSKKGKFLGRRITYPFLRFHNDYLNLGKSFTSKEKLKKVAKKFDAIICGSDQIWAPSVFDPVYFLDFVPKNVKKISYAASIGLNYIKEELKTSYHDLLSDFSAVSVREEKGRELLDKECKISSTVVADPTLMLDVLDWKKIQRKPTDLDFDFEKPFIFCYFLNSQNNYQKSVIDYAKRNGLQIIGYSLKTDDATYMYDVTKYIGPREFLWLISKAHTVVTDSYHATIFSTLYEKRFITYERFSENDPVNQNSRIYQLVDYFSIGDRIVSGDVKSFDVPPLNYQKVQDKLKELREKSLSFLFDALGE